jgi:hypothetical protein
MWEKMAEVHVLMGATGANVSLHFGGGRANEVRPRFICAPGQVSLTLRPSRKPSSSLSREATEGDVPSVLGSFDIVDQGNEEFGLPGYPRAPLLHAV